MVTIGIGAAICECSDWLQVEAGRNVSVVIGALVYDGHKTDVPMLIIVLIGGIAIFVLIIVVFICLMYRYKSRQKDRRLRHMMDVMEARVAKECKEGTLSWQHRLRLECLNVALSETCYNVAS